MSAAARKKLPPELREAAEQDASRVKELEALYAPMREAAQAELQKTKSGRKMLEEARALGKELSELFESVESGRTPQEEGALLARVREEQFHTRHRKQLLKQPAAHAHLQPSVQAVAQILRPEMAPETTWVAETSPRGSMLLQPKTSPDDIDVVRQGLDEPPPAAAVQSCCPAPYDLNETYLIPAPFALSGESRADKSTGVTWALGGCVAIPVIPLQVGLASAFVGHDFAVPPGPTKYKATITYDWNCSGYGGTVFGISAANCDLAIVIDKRDGTRETHAREVSLLTVPFAGADSFFHRTTNARVSIPFTRDGSNGTVRIMVGADGHCMATAAWMGSATFYAVATVREICLSSVG